jgi:hypothetical protein
LGALSLGARSPQKQVVVIFLSFNNKKYYLQNLFSKTKRYFMSLPTNNKKSGNKNTKNQINPGGGSKFIKTNSKPGGAKQKVRSTGANRGS